MNKSTKTAHAIISFLAIALYFLLSVIKLQAVKVPSFEGDISWMIKLYAKI